MPQLRGDSSRSYPGRSDRRAAHLGSVDGSNIANDRSEVSRGHSTCSHTGKGRTQEGIGVPASSPSALTPDGPVSRRRVADQPNPNTSLLERILSRENMLLAWQQVKANQGSYGVDKMTITALPEYARAHWATIRASLLAGTYKPLPVRRVEIPKPAGGKRPLGIPTVLDRMIQQAIAQVLGPIFDPTFSVSSFGYRPGRSAHQAIYQLRGYIQQGYRVAVDMDLSKFFDTVNHDALMHRVAKRVHDKRVLHLIGKYLRAGVVIKGRLEATRQGVPQGGPLSPLLSNVMLDDLDKELERRGHRFARYADDFVILVKSQCAGERVMASVTRFLEQRLRLRVNTDKSRVCSTNDCAFLGFTFRGTKIRWLDRAFDKFKRRVRLLTGRSWRVSMSYRIKKLNQYLQGWTAYFGISEYYRPFGKLDAWIRRRIRMCFWKQWRYARTKVRELRKLGTRLDTAIVTAISRKGPWRLSRTLATQTGMTNQWLTDLGLLNVKELWCKIHYPASPKTVR
ncbi:MAG: group II intron reverse transcriptase/maturase [Phycisphaeraceae bacterium]|nr:group II intron reverse transcriptase/maturase [Phycisphaeraceae bacterium]